MTWALEHPRTVIASTIATVIVMVPIVMATPREILPRVDEGTVIGTLKLQEGTSLEETIRQVARIEAIGAAEVARRVAPLWGWQPREAASRLSRFWKGTSMPSDALFALLSVLGLTLIPTSAG
jgi:hypothetical protein